MFISDSHYVGFDVTKSGLRIAKLRKKRNGWDIPFIKEVSAQDNVKLLYKQLGEGLTLSAIETKDLLLRSCEIPLKKPKDVFAALNFHVEPLLPYPLDKAIIQAEIAGQQEQGTTVTLFAVRKDHLERHLNAFEQYQIEPEMITTRVHALLAFSSLLPPIEAPFLLIHESEEEISALFIEKGKLLAARSFDPKRNLTSEIQKTLLSLSTAHKGKSFDTLYFIGKNPELKQALQTISGKPAQPPTSPSLSLTQDELIHYSLAIGCALAHSTVNFRQKEFSYPHPFRRFRKPLLLFFALSLFFTTALALFSEMALAHKKEKLAEAYLSLYRTEGKNVATAPDRASNYMISLAQLAKEVHAHPERYPLLPQVPKVKEVLSWIASLPISKGIVIESLQYQMVKRPDINNRREKYKVRVELEMSATDTNAARLFQDALKSSGPLIDSQEEVQWVPLKGKYKASFYLKDKTKYD